MKFENVQVVLQSRLLSCRFEAKKKSERQIWNPGIQAFYLNICFFLLKGVK